MIACRKRAHVWISRDDNALGLHVKIGERVSSEYNDRYIGGPQTSSRDLWWLIGCPYLSRELLSEDLGPCAKQQSGEGERLKLRLVGFFRFSLYGTIDHIDQTGLHYGPCFLIKQVNRQVVSDISFQIIRSIPHSSLPPS